MIVAAPPDWGWTYLRTPEEQWDHVIPDNDLREHETNPSCWCHPVEDDETDDDEYVLIHQSLDRREDYQLGQRRLN